MGNFKFFALGGLGEVGKNMYVFETEHDLYILDIGSKTPPTEVNGYDSLVSDYTYVLEHLDKLRGVFISKFGEKSSRAFLRVIRDLKVPFYGSPFTIEAIKRRYMPFADEEDKDVDFRVMHHEEILEFEDSKIEAFGVTTSVPDSYGFAIKINTGDEENPSWKNCVYLPDCDLDQNMWGHFRTDFKSITRIADEGVLVYFSSSSGAGKVGHITTDGSLDLALRKIMAQEGRTYLLMDAENISGILQVIDAAYVQKRRVTIIGHKARFLVELAMELNYTRVNKNLYMPKEVLDDEKRNADDAVVIIAGDQLDTFHFMEGIATFQDKHYRLKRTDNVAILLDTPKKFEKELAITWNNIWFNNAKILDFDINLMPVPMAGAEDLKLLYSLFSPEYVVPISGDYRMLKAQNDLLYDFGFKKENVIIIDNGDVVEYKDGSIRVTDDPVPTKEILFGNAADSDINDFVAREREALTKEGFVVISGMINLKERELYGNIEIVTSGFLPEYGQEEEFEGLKETFKDIVKEHLRMRKVDYKDLRQELKNELSKKILKDTKKRPILIPVIIDISGTTATVAD